MQDHTALVLHEGNNILFIQRASTKNILPNRWAFPSGTVERGEAPAMTVVREAREELGIDVAIEKVFAVFEIHEQDVLLHYFLCTSAKTRAIILDPKEIQDMKWRTFQEFFNTHSDEQIGHGLRYLRRHPEVWEGM
ncbi:MAG: NUDIX hydrolase [Patescibacteria group bacterium]